MATVALETEGRHPPHLEGKWGGVTGPVRGAAGCKAGGNMSGVGGLACKVGRLRVTLKGNGGTLRKGKHEGQHSTAPRACYIRCSRTPQGAKTGGYLGLLSEQGPSQTWNTDTGSEVGPCGWVTQASELTLHPPFVVHDIITYLLLYFIQFFLCGAG